MIEPVNGAIENVIALNHAVNGLRPTDYIGEDGMVWCSVCGERREMIVPPPINARVFIQCKCDREAAQRDHERREGEEIKRRQRICFEEYPRYMAYTFQSDDNPESSASRICRKYAEKFSQVGNMGLLLYGGVGAGKSYLAACICNKCLSFGFTARMTSFSSLLDEITRANMKSRDEPLRALNEDAVVLDDFGAERNTEYATEQVFKILTRRLETRKPIIVTTNLAPQDFRTDDLALKRIYDRVLEVCKPVLVEGASRRAGGRKAKWAELDEILNG